MLTSEGSVGEVLVASQQERVNAVLTRCFRWGYEDNPARTEWPHHPVDADFPIRVPQDQRGECYYMIELYLTEEEQSELIGWTESLPAFLDIYQSGRCSLHDLLHTYTPEKLDLLLDQAEAFLATLKAKRDAFEIRQRSYSPTP